MAQNSKGIETAEIITDQCMGCQICVAECPVGAIEMMEGTAHIDPELCIGCGKCQEVCPVSAVRFEKTEKRLEADKEIKKTTKSLQERSDVAVYIEVREGRGAEVSWELVGKAHELAVKGNGRVIGFLLGHGIHHVIEEAVAYGCDEVTSSTIPFSTAIPQKPSATP